MLSLGNITRYFLLLAVSVLISFGIPFSALAVNNESTVFGDPAEYFPGCACSSVFICFVIWMVALIIIAMFQYGDGKTKKKKLSPVAFSAIAIGLLFIIFSIPLFIMAGMLKPENFPLNPESGNYEFSKYGEKAAESKLTGSYTEDELIGHISDSREYMITALKILTIACVVAMASIPPYLMYRAKKKETDFTKKKKKKPSKGKIGTRKSHNKPDEGKK